MRVLAGRVQREVEHGETKDSCPAMAATVYSLGRRRLWRAQLVAGRSQCFYCDTDSLFLDGVGFGRLADSGLIREGVPGELRLVGVHDWMEIYGVRHYRVPCRTVCAGNSTKGAASESPGAGNWRRRTAAESVVLGRSPSAEEVLERVERVSPYRHGVRGAGGIVAPWEVNEA